MDKRISLTQENIEYLRRAFSHFFPEDTIYAADKPFESGEFNWKNRADFIDFVYRLTGISIKSERDLGAIKKAQLEIENLLSESSSPEKPVESNMPDKEARENLEAERQARQEAIEESKRKADEAVRKSVERQQEIYKSQAKIIQAAPKDIQKNVLTEIGGKTLYAVPATKVPEVVFSENEQKLVDIAKNDPQLFSQKLSQLIAQKNPDIPKEILEPLSQVIAVDTTQALINPAQKPVPVGVFAAATKVSEQIPGLSAVAQTELAKTTSVFTVFTESKDNLYRTVLLRSLGENITDTVLGPAEQQYVLSTEKSDEAFTIKLDQLQNNSFSFQEGDISDSFNSPVTESVKGIAESKLRALALAKTKSLGTTGALGKVSSLANSQAFDSIAPFLGLQTNFEYVGTNFFGKLITRVFPDYAPLITNIAGRLGINVGIQAVAPVATEMVVVEGAVVAESAVVTEGITEGAVAKAVAGKSLNITLGNAIARGASSILSKIGMQAAAAKVGAMVGTGIIPVIGTVVGLILGAVFGKILEKAWPWIKKNAPYLIGAVLGVGTFAIAGPLAGVIAGVGAFGLASAATSGAITLGSVGAGIAGLFAAIGTLIVGPIVMPFLIIFLIVPIVVALILFVINSGAYIVPPVISTEENPYISITKVAAPEGPFQNSQLPRSIKYTVTIAAKKGPLTNISYNETCNVSKKGGTANCPDVKSQIPQPPDTISPSVPVTFDYTTTYTKEFTDSIVTNTFSVSAYESGGENITTSGSSSVIFGSPPTGCFTFADGWNNTEKSKEIDAITKVSRATTYMATLCSNGPINLHRVGSGSGCGGGGGVVTSANDIEIYDAGVNCSTFVTFYTLAHESGHIYAHRTSKYTEFLDSGATDEGLICTYPNSLAKSEDFAEMIALYYTKVAGSTKAACMRGTLQTAYPLHWDFAHNHIFMENLDW